jgi:hypothetical protein
MSIGIGGMVGGGIFAVTGLTVHVTKSAFYGTGRLAYIIARRGELPRGARADDARPAS